MKCDCCGRKKKLFESFAQVKAGKVNLHLCVDCNDLLYKLRDAASDGDRSSFDAFKAALDRRGKKYSDAFGSWLPAFIEQHESKLGEPKFGSATASSQSS